VLLPGGLFDATCLLQHALAQSDMSQL